MEEGVLELKKVTFRHLIHAPTRIKPWRKQPGPGVLGVSLRLQPGEILGLVGPNGAGKTTLLRMIAGVLPIEKGKIHLNKNGTFEALDGSSLRTVVGHMPEQVRWQGRQTVEDALFELAQMRGSSLKRVNDLLRLVGLAERTKTPLSSLSQGMRQRLTLAAALLGTPKYLLLDEPLNGLDPVAAAAFIRLLKQLTTKGVSIVISSHQVEGLQAITDRVALMHRGQVLACGTLEAIAQNLGLTSTIEARGIGDAPDFSWCNLTEQTEEKGQWTAVLHDTQPNMLAEVLSRGIDFNAWIPKPPGIVEMLCAATGMDVEEVGLDIATAAMLPHRRLGGEEE